MTTSKHQSTTLPLFHNAHYGESKYEFDTTRKAVDIAQSLINCPIPGVEVIDPTNYYEEAERVISTIHSPEYVKAVRTGKPRQLAQSSSFTWDKDIFTMARAHTAGMIGAAINALMTDSRQGSLSSGMHHASFDRGAGYCTFNGLAAAIQASINVGAQRFLVLDFDAHAGGGTWNIMQRLFPEKAVQIDVTVSAFDTWTPIGDSRLDIVDSKNYIPAINASLEHAASLAPFDLIIYNAGVDIRNSGVSEADLRTRERLVSEFIGTSSAIFGLAGGYTWGRYNIDDVVGWHRLTIAEWARPR